MPPAGWARSVVAVDVVVARRPGQLADHAEQVRRVGAREVDQVLRVGERGERGRDRLLGLLSDRRGGAQGVGEVIGRAVAVQRGAEVAEHRHRVPGHRAQLAQERGQISGTTSFVSATSGSRSSSAARRLTNVVFAWRITGGSSCRSWLNASFSAAIAPKRLVRVRGQLRELLAAVGEDPEDLRSGDQELAQRRLVAGSARRTAAGSPGGSARSTCRWPAPPRCCRCRRRPAP